MKVIIKTPATSANLGPGFDCLGLALGLYNEISFEKTGDCLEITGCPPEYAGPDNMAAAAYRKAAEACGKNMPEGLKIRIHSEIPVSRGLGSSASLIVSGIAAANLLEDLQLSKNDMLGIAAEIEGHPDNVCPCLFGGLTAAVTDAKGPLTAFYPVSPELCFTVIIPDFQLSTAKSRGVLPDTVPRKDGVYTLGCLAMLLKGLESGDSRMLAYALDDRLHQPYRKPLIPDFERIRESAAQLGAAGTVISGAGSTILCVGGGADFSAKMADAMQTIQKNWKVLSLPIEMEGTTWNTIF